MCLRSHPGMLIQHILFFHALLMLLPRTHELCKILLIFLYDGAPTTSAPSLESLFAPASRQEMKFGTKRMNTFFFFGGRL